MEQRQLIIIAKLGMLGLTILSSWLACLELPALFQMAVLAYQGIILVTLAHFRSRLGSVLESLFELAQGRVATRHRERDPGDGVSR